MQKSLKSIYLFVLLGMGLFLTLGLVWRIQPYVSCDSPSMESATTSLSIKEKTLRFEENLKHKINFRSRLIHLNSMLKFKIFKSSLDPEQVVLGDEGWLYYSSKSDFSYESITRANSFKEDAIAPYVQEIKKRQDFLNKRGILNCHAFWPNKSTIVSNYLPKKLWQQTIQQPSRMEQVYDFANVQYTDLCLVDIRNDFYGFPGPLYLKHDSHWNDRGAFMAYQSLMSSLGLEAHTVQDFTWALEETTKGDLLSLVGLCNASSITEEIPKLTFKGNKLVEKIEREGRAGPKFTCVGAENKMTLLMFRDSYGSALRQFLSLHFETAYYPWSDYDQELVDELQPDVIIVAKVERYM